MYFFSLLRIITLVTVVGGFPLLHAASFSLSLAGGIPAVLPLPYTSDGSALFNVLTGRPTGQGKKLHEVLEEAQNSESKEISLKVFRNFHTGLLELSDGTEKYDFNAFSLVATYRLIFAETDLTIIPYIESVAPSQPPFLDHTAAHYYPLHPAPQWGYLNAEPWYPQPLILGPYVQQFSYQYPQHPCPQQHYEPSPRTLQIRFRELHVALHAIKKRSQEQGSLLTKEQEEKERLVKEIAELKATLQQHVTIPHPTSPSPSPASPHTEVTEPPSEQLLQHASPPPLPSSDCAPLEEVPQAIPTPASDMVTGTPPTITQFSSPLSATPHSVSKRQRHRRKKNITVPALHTFVEDDKDDEYERTVLPDPLVSGDTEEVKKEGRNPEKTERDRLRKAAQETERATQAMLWKQIENACANKQFSTAFTTIKGLDQNTPLYTKGLLAIVKALSKTSSEETPSSEIIKAAQDLSEAKTGHDEWVVKHSGDRRMLIEFLLKHSSEDDQEDLLAEATRLGNVLAGTRWHLLQMKKPEPCGRKSCAHKSALHFFSSHADNTILRTHIPRYLAMIQATQCPHQKDSASIVKTLMEQARSSDLPEADIQTIEARVPTEYKEKPPVTPAPPLPRKATPPTVQEKFELYKITVVSAIERNDLQAAKDATVAFIQEHQNIMTPLEKLLVCITDGFASVNNQSSIALNLTTLMCIETIIEIFESKVSLNHVETLLPLFEKILLPESNRSQTRPEQCLAILHLKLSRILNPFFIQIKSLHTDFINAKKVLTKKHRLKLTAILEKAETPENVTHIMRSVSKYASNDEQGFYRQVTSFIETFINTHSEKKIVWKEYLISPEKNFSLRLKGLYEVFGSNQDIVTNIEIMKTNAPMIFKDITTREDAENFMTALKVYANKDKFSFFGLTTTFLQEFADAQTNALKELWNGLLPTEEKNSWCALL